MAPLTIFRADDAHVPLPIVTEYYAQRACEPGALLISEATFISQRAGGLRNLPEIESQHLKYVSDNSADHLRYKVTENVHQEGSKIFCQLWALGRAPAASSVGVTGEEGIEIVSSSAISIDENSTTPRAMIEKEIWAFIADYTQAAKNSVAAGFDGVEIHSANRYLVDQFTKDTCNQRTDAWGGSVKNRSRFAFEVAKACAVAIGPDRVGIRISP